MATIIATGGRLARPRTNRRQQLLLTREELRQYLNEDLRRERKTCLALQFLTRRGREAKDVSSASLLEKSRRMCERHASQIERLLLDIEGKVSAEVDELNTALGATRVLEHAWIAESIYNLHERARQLRTAGFSGLAKRMMRIVTEKQVDAVRS